MLVLTTQAAVFAASCYVIAADPGRECLILDPGVGVAADVARLVERHALTPVAIAGTHGHPDHLWDAAALSDRWDIPVLLHVDDLGRLADPARALGPGMAEGFLSLVPAPWRAPDRSGALPTTTLDVAPGLEITLVSAPGHTPGSTVYVVTGTPSPSCVVPRAVTGRALPPTTALAFTGDVLFAGSMGRTDLPGGDDAAMARTLARLRSELPADAWILPGHGPSSTLAHEKSTNPYLSHRWTSPRGY